MKTIAVALCAALAGAGVVVLTAQTAERVDSDMVAKIREEGLKLPGTRKLSHAHGRHRSAADRVARAQTRRRVGARGIDALGSLQRPPRAVRVRPGLGTRQVHDRNGRAEIHAARRIPGSVEPADARRDRRVRGEPCRSAAGGRQGHGGEPQRRGNHDPAARDQFHPGGPRAAQRAPRPAVRGP